MRILIVGSLKKNEISNFLNIVFLIRCISKIDLWHLMGGMSFFHERNVHYSRNLTSKHKITVCFYSQLDKILQFISFFLFSFIYLLLAENLVWNKMVLGTYLMCWTLFFIIFLNAHICVCVCESLNHYEDLNILNWISLVYFYRCSKANIQDILLDDDLLIDLKNLTNLLDFLSLKGIISHNILMLLDIVVFSTWW